MTEKRAAIYCRISSDPEGKAVGVERQEIDAKALAESRGFKVTRVFVDNDRGASTKSKKPRPAYAEMITAAESGEVDVIVSYSNSRLTRRPLEFEGLIQLSERHGVEIDTCVSGKADLSTADGRAVARTIAAWDAAEAERTAERVTRAIKGNREKGIGSIGGIRPFGFSAADRTKKDATEAAAIEQAARIILNDGNLNDVIRFFEAEEIKPVRAAKWSRKTVEGMLKAPRIAGLMLVEDVLTEAVNIPAILDRATWDALQEALKPGFKRPAGYSKPNSLLTGFVYCADCGNRMAVKGPHYGCLSHRGGCGKVFRAKAFVDGLVIEAVEKHLTQALGREMATVETVDNSEEIARLEAQVSEVSDAYKSGALPAADAFPMMREMREGIDRLRKAAAEAVKAKVAIPAEQALADWQSGNLEAMRRILPAEVQAVVIKPVGKGYGRHKPLPPESVEIVWAD